MPGDVVSGQKIGGNLSAGDWNRMRAHLARTEPPKGFGVPPGGGDESAVDGVVLVKNSASETFAPGEVVGLESPEFTASDTENTIRNNLHFKGAVPTSDHTGKFGVVLGGLAADGTGPAQIHGLCWAKLNMTAEGDAFADIEADEKILKSGSSGAAQILYAFPKGTEYPQETVGYVRVGNKASSGSLDASGAQRVSELEILTTHSSASPVIGILTAGLHDRFEDDTDAFAYFDTGDSYFKITEDGDYIVFFSFICSEVPGGVIAADAQEVGGRVTKQTGSGGSPSTILSAFGTLEPPGATANEDISITTFAVVSLVDGDWLTTAFYNGTSLGTKVIVGVGAIRVLLLKLPAVT